MQKEEDLILTISRGRSHLPRGGKAEPDFRGKGESPSSNPTAETSQRSSSSGGIAGDNKESDLRRRVLFDHYFHLGEISPNLKGKESNTGLTYTYSGIRLSIKDDPLFSEDVFLVLGKR